MDNGQLRLLTGHMDDIDFGGCARTLLDEAKRNLTDHFAVVGLSERFDESLLLIRRRLGWKRLPVYRRRNVAERKSSTAQLSASALAAIRKHNELDLELYEWASAKFQREWETEGLQRELQRFRVINAMYQSYGRLRRASSRLLSGRGALAAAR
jgi:hypothetical protein